MENSSQPPITPKKTISKKKLLIFIISAVLLLGIATATVFVLYKFQVMGAVHDSLVKAAATMEESNKENGYPQSLPKEIVENDSIEISGGGSFDGTTYCITGVSKQDSSIKYHIKSADNKPQGGVCPDVADGAKPGEVTGVVQTIRSAGQLGFSWNSAEGAASYTLECATDKAFTQGQSSSMKASLTRTCDNLKDGVNYFVRVRGNNASGAGPWSSSLTVSTGQLSVAPENLTVKAASTTSISYTWNAVAGAQSYLIEWASDINFTKDVKRTTQNATSGTASGLKPNTQYFFHVKAITSGFNSTQAAFSPIAYTTTSK